MTENYIDFNENMIQKSDKIFLKSKTLDNEFLDLLNIDKKWKDYIRIVDEDEDLILIHYLNIYKDENKKELNKNIMKEIGHIRGIIIEKTTKKIICNTSKNFEEIVVSDDLSETKFLENYDIKDYKISNIIEGTNIRCYFYNNKWYLSTFKKLNAFKSKILDTNFGDIFTNIYKENFDFALNKKYKYLFLISSNKNRFIYKVPENKVYLIDIYDENNNLLQIKDYPKNLNFEISENLNFENQKEIFNYVLSLQNNHSYNKCGIILSSIKQPNQGFRLINNYYYNLTLFRGNNPDIRICYLNSKSRDVGDLLNIYKKEEYYLNLFKDLDKKLHKFTLNLLKIYFNRYIHKQIINVSSFEHFILKNCHNDYLQNKNNKISYNKILSFILKSSSYTLLKFL